MRDVLLIDNHDSFTFNIAALIEQVLGRAPAVVPHEQLDLDLTAYAAIVVGPGPGRPQHPDDLGLSARALQQRDVPVLGICLGMQGLAHLQGWDVGELDPPMHGRVSPVVHDGTGLFAGLDSPLEVVRYHSLHVAGQGELDALRVTARAADDDCVMAVSDATGLRAGVQFHPESVLSQQGAQLLANFFDAAGVSPSARGANGSAMSPQEPRRDRASAPPREVAIECVPIGTDVDLWQLHERAFATSPDSFWLDSSGARWSAMGDATGPWSHVLHHHVTTDPPLIPTMREHLRQWRVARDEAEAYEVPIRPGFVGYVGYEVKAETGGEMAHQSPHPDARLIFADRLVVCDHQSGRAYALFMTDESVEVEQRVWAERLQRIAAESTKSCSEGLEPSDARAHAQPVAHEPLEQLVPNDCWRHGPQDYLALIGRAQELIRQGESYEVCLTNHVAWPEPVGEAAAYAAMRRVSPVPFGAWLRGPEVSVLAASPERFVSVDASGRVETRPIKGTRPRSADPEEDTRLADELSASVKERAENLMIVDLLRHDLHRVCSPGTVHVPGLCEVESYATVHQLVSTIQGQRAPELDALDVLESCFPGGSMTGAPKERTMAIIDRLEGGPRGVYSGVIGWFGINDAMDTSIVIRSATWANGRVEYGVGGAITALSDPAEELEEVQHKSRSVALALRAAQTSGAE